MGKLFGGGSSSTTTTVNIPPPSETELELQKVQLEVAQKQLGLFEGQAESQDEAFNVLSGQLEQLTKASDAALAQAAGTDPLFKEIAQKQLDILNRGGRASDEEKQLIAEATAAASAQGKSDIQTFERESLENIRNILGPSRGLRPGDTPLLDAGGRVSTEANRQFGQLQSGLAETRANAELNFPLARDQLLSGVGQFQQQLAESARNFQSNIRQQSFQNQLQLQAFRQSGPLALLGTPSPGSSLLASLSGQRVAGASSTSTKKETPSFLDIIKGVGTVAAGFST